MACNCKGQKKIDKITDKIAEISENDFDKKGILYYIGYGIEYIIYLLKLLFICICIILATPFISLFVIWGFLTNDGVTVKVPSFLK